MITPQDKKIAIFGCAGSGKTALAFRLKEKLELPLCHLDQYHWQPNWQAVEREEFLIAHHALCDEDAWIIEGSYISLLFYRLMHADVIIFLDIPRYKCLWHAIKRAIVHRGNEIPGSPAGCKQRLFSFAFLAFLKWIWHFDKRNKKIITAMLDELKDKKKIYVLRSIDEADKVL